MTKTTEFDIFHVKWLISIGKLKLLPNIQLILNICAEFFNGPHNIYSAVIFWVQLLMWIAEIFICFVFRVISYWIVMHFCVCSAGVNMHRAHNRESFYDFIFRMSVYCTYARNGTFNTLDDFFCSVSWLLIVAHRFPYCQISTRDNVMQIKKNFLWTFSTKMPETETKL